MVKCENLKGLENNSSFPLLLHFYYTIRHIPLVVVIVIVVGLLTRVTRSFTGRTYWALLDYVAIVPCPAVDSSVQRQNTYIHTPNDWYRPSGCNTRNIQDMLDRNNTHIHQIIIILT